MALALVTAKS